MNIFAYTFDKLTYQVTTHILGPLITAFFLGGGVALVRNSG